MTQYTCPVCQGLVEPCCPGVDGKQLTLTRDLKSRPASTDEFGYSAGREQGEAAYVCWTCAMVMPVSDCYVAPTSRKDLAAGERP